jgi:uncharacterized protein
MTYVPLNVQVEWDENKRETNLEKHGLDFTDAVQVLQGDLLELDDDYDDEPRVLAFGLLGLTVVLVVYTMREETYRIISMRKAEPDEERAYLQDVF